MARLLIVNADDFGLSKGQNYGIIEAHQHGIVTSTTAMVNGKAIAHAVELSQHAPDLGIGMHFVLTLGEPLSAMPTFARDGQLGKWVWQMAEEGRLPLQEIRRELACQYQRFIELFGYPPTHIDSHHHVHLIPDIYTIVEGFACEKGIPLRSDRQLVPHDGLDHNVARRCEGFSSAFYGDSISEALFLHILDDSLQRGESSLEVMCHPAFVDNTIIKSAYCYPRLLELDILTSSSLRQEVAKRGYRLTNFKMI
ncbi:chitin disaccharide deacetylase [Rosenbergiella sp. S61]|uniref:Chitooligosaccharide deacetylase n=1 Tax=Rosenbergiella gaditana TaxID=2726987 RepID=A0ABS5SYA2_9GAMM|nr:chitin disaccharide deacetylase [Rosenbergiella gaditana]MBT0725092.1 chitin disaccharide deacetylase [Rosenbergiella gaditana]